MSWFGKVAGATIGFIIGGPLGAAGGAFLGHKLLDNTDSMSGHEKIQANYFIALFSMLGKMAKADGKVTTDEVESVERIITQNLKLSGDQRKFAINIFNGAKDSNHSFDEFANNFYQINIGSPNMLYSMLATLFEVARADGELHPNEEILLGRARTIFRISDHDYTTLKKQFFPEIESEKYYGILKCLPSDSDKTIKSNYRMLVREFHPDKIVKEGLPEELMIHAKEKFQEIQDAYEVIKKQRGF